MQTALWEAHFFRWSPYTRVRHWGSQGGLREPGVGQPRQGDRAPWVAAAPRRAPHGAAVSRRAPWVAAESGAQAHLGW